MIGKCLICETPRETLDKNRHYPFCSGQCRMADLARWFNEEYSVPASPPEWSEDSGQTQDLPPCSNES